MIIKFLRSFIARNKKLYLALLFCTVLCYGTLVSFQQVSVSLDSGLDDYLSQYSYYDGIVQADYIRDDMKKELEELSQIKEVHPRLVIDAGVVCKGGKKQTLRLMGVDGSEMRYFSSEPAQNDDFKISVAYGKGNQLSMGDTIHLEAGGHEWDQHVDALVNTPELMGYVRNETSGFETTEFGVAYLPLKQLQERLDQKSIFNCVTYTVNDGCNEKEAYEKIVSILGSSNVQQGQYGEERTAAVNIKNDLDTLEPIADNLPKLMYLLGLFFTILFIRQFIQIKRTQIGILRANGCSIAKISFLFMTYAASVAAGGSILGGVLSVFETKLLLWVYTSSMAIPSISVIYDWKIMIAAALLAVLINVLGVIFNIMEIYRVDPVDCIRGDAPKERKLPEIFTGLFYHMGYTAKMNLCTVIRRPIRFCLSVICILFCVMLVVGAVGVMDSKTDMIKDAYEHRLKADKIVYLNKAYEKEEFNRLNQELLKSEGEGIYETEVKLTSEADTDGLKTTMQVFDSSVDMISIFNIDGSLCNLPQKGIVLSDTTAQHLEAAVGDTVKINGEEIEVASVARESFLLREYMSREQYKLISDDKSSLLTNVVLLGKKTNANQVSNDDRIEYINDVSTLENDAKVKMSYIDRYVAIIILLCSFVSGLVIYNMSVLYFRERRHDHAIMITQGLNTAAITAFSLIEVFIQYLLAIAGGIPLGYVITSSILEQLNSDYWHFYVIYNKASIVTVALLILAALIISRVLSAAELRRADLEILLKQD